MFMAAGSGREILNNRLEGNGAPYRRAIAQVDEGVRKELEFY